MKKKLENYFRTLYRLIFKNKKKEIVVWNDLKKLRDQSNWYSTTQEKKKLIECNFELSENHKVVFYYYIKEEHLNCYVRIFELDTLEIPQEFFHLVAHFNSLLIFGHINVNISERSFDFQTKKEISILFYNPEEIHYQIVNHFLVAKDIYASFQRLLSENEDPVVIIGDLLRKQA